jgi:phage gpG-like protein
MKFNESRKIVKAMQEFDGAFVNLVRIAGTDAVNHFTKSFRDQGFTDNSLERWEPRKGDFVNGISRLRKRERIRSGRAILVKSGALRRSLRKISKSRLSVTIISDLPYANVHNEGLTSGRSRFKMKKREFVGYSEVLNKKLIRRIETGIKQVFK